MESTPDPVVPDMDAHQESPVMSESVASVQLLFGNNNVFDAVTSATSKSNSPVHSFVNVSTVQENITSCFVESELITGLSGFVLSTILPVTLDTFDTNRLQSLHVRYQSTIELAAQSFVFILAVVSSPEFIPERFVADIAPENVAPVRAALVPIAVAIFESTVAFEYAVNSTAVLKSDIVAAS